MQVAFTDAIVAARDELSVELVTTQEQLIEAQRLRYRVYCEERGFEAGVDGLEKDVFDHKAQHILVRFRETGGVVGTVRVVMFTTHEGFDGFPMQRVCGQSIFTPLPVQTTGEVSRFALTRDRAGASQGAAALMRLCLFQGVIRICGETGLTHLCAAMERSLLRLLGATGIHFQPVGPMIEYHGHRQPATCSVSVMLDRLRHEQPLVWEFITERGSLCHDPATQTTPLWQAKWRAAGTKPR